MKNNNNINSISFNSFYFQNLIPSYFKINKNIKEIANEKNFHWNSVRQDLVLNALKSEFHGKNVFYLKKICQQLKPSQLNELVKTTLNIAPEEQLKNDSFAGFNRLKEIITLEQIEAAVRSEHPSFEGAFNNAKIMKSYAKYHLELVEPLLIKSTIKILVNKIIWALENAIDTLLAYLGITQFENDVENDNDAQIRFQTFLALVSGISTCVTLLVALTSSPLLGIAIVGGGIALGCLALGLYTKYLKPAPRSIQGCQNLTATNFSKNFFEIQGRENYIDEIAMTLIASRSKPKTHPLLIGRSGVGKTEIIKAFAKAVADGRYPELKGKQVFYLNTADLTQMSTSFSLEKIQKRINRRRNDVILVFDEIHHAAKGQGLLAEKLKTLLDDGSESFPFVIAATTDEEFKKYIVHNNESLARRFKQIPIPEMNRDQTIAILNKTILRQGNLHATHEAIEAIYDLSSHHFSNYPQPYMACRILGQAIAKIRNVADFSIQTKIAEEQTLLEKHLSMRLLKENLFFNEDSSHNAEKELQKIYQRLDDLNILLNKEKEHRLILKKLTEKFEADKKRLFDLSIKIDRLQNPKSKKISSLLKEFALVSFYLNTASDKAIQAYMSTTGQQFAHIGLPLIQQLIENEVALENQKNSMLYAPRSS